MKIKLLLLSSFMLTTLFTGCAFKDQKIDVEYSSDGKKASYEGTVCLNKIKDIREDKSRIGIVKNTYGMETANVITDQNVSLLISNAIKDELIALGYTVNLIDVAFGEGINLFDGCDVLDGNLKNMFVEPIFGIFAVDGKAIITVELVIATQTGKEFKKTYSTNGKSRSYVGGFAQLQKEAMDKALTALILEIKADLPNVLGQ
jgi:uncharacterized lipoprotein YajG